MLGRILSSVRVWEIVDVNWLTKFFNAWKNFIIRTGLDSNSGVPPELSTAKKHRLPGLKGIRSIHLPS